MTSEGIRKQYKLTEPELAEALQTATVVAREWISKHIMVIEAERTAALAERDQALAKLAGAVETLRPFSDCADRIDRIDRQSDSVTPDDASYRYSPGKGPGPTVGDIRQARAALTSLPAEAESLLADKARLDLVATHTHFDFYDLPGIPRLVLMTDGVRWQIQRYETDGCTLRFDVYPSFRAALDVIRGGGAE